MQLDELLGQGQTKSCPFALVLIVAAHLAKLLEDPGLVLGGDADAGVSDRDFHCAITLSGVNSNPSSLRGELHRIGQQIEKYLLDLALVADKLAKALVHGNIECDAVPCRALAHKGARVVYRQREIKRSQLQLHAAGLDFGEIEYLIDQRQEMAAGGKDVVGVLGLFLVKLAEQSLAQDFGEADDGVERRAQLVRHVGEEFRFVPVGGLDLPALILDLAEQPRILYR